MATGNKTGGRKKGTPNKATKAVREALVSIMNEEFKQIPELLMQLEPERRIDILIKLLPYCIPKIQQVEQQWMFEDIVRH